MSISAVDNKTKPIVSDDECVSFELQGRVLPYLPAWSVNSGREPSITQLISTDRVEHWSLMNLLVTRLYTRTHHRWSFNSHASTASDAPLKKLRVRCQ